MYDGIFNDFKIIKIHCQKNGNIRFEESAVFELLENLFPQYGSSEAVQIIIEMLDAQTISDFKETRTESSLKSDESNDDDIIEVEVPEKVYPFIDLTNESSEISEILIEPSSNENLDTKVESDVDFDTKNHDSVTSDNDYNEFNDSDNWKPFCDYWDSTSTDVVGFNNESPILECLIRTDEPHKSNNFEVDQSNSGIAEVSQMLEEKNNDPNNNLDGITFEEATSINNAPEINDDSNLNRPDSVIDSVFYPVAGCSKDKGIALCDTNYCRI